MVLTRVTASRMRSRTCRLGFGVFSAEGAAGLNLFDALAHTWDIAATTSIDLDESSELWAKRTTRQKGRVGSHRGPGSH
jgi:hypothetical protein